MMLAGLSRVVWHAFGRHNVFCRRRYCTNPAAVQESVPDHP